VHLGHLWLVAALDLLGSTTAAFNGMALLSPALAWFAAFLLLRDLCGEPRVAMVLSFAWGTGLHVFRDLIWYTIEKAAIFGAGTIVAISAPTSLAVKRARELGVTLIAVARRDAAIVFAGALAPHQELAAS
jgi:hypothetical protein